ncbi:MAG TPA: helix-turn-helix domain-containing protein [Solirubrobacteraceae bacterium]|nr:helix-turn-helix domain-containing protein [Solirubrobacteraceae bacterium]
MPLHRGYEGQECSVAGTLALVGERWTLLVIRELMLGVHRFDDLQRDLGIARNILQDRLERLAEAQLISRRTYQPHPPRYEYRLTERGLDLWPVIVALMQWGDRHLSWPDGPPVTLEHRDCGGELDGHLCCERCGARLGPRDVWAQPGAGTAADHPLRRRAARP